MNNSQQPEQSPDAPDPPRPAEPIGDRQAAAGDAARESQTSESHQDAAAAGDPRVEPRNHGFDRDTSARSPRVSSFDELDPGRNEFLGVLGLIVLCDLTIYRGEGFAGFALLFTAAPLLLWWSSSQRCRGPALWIVAAMLVALGTKLLWSGSDVLVAIGFALIVAFAMSIAGFRPYPLEAAFFATQSPHAGYRGLIQYSRQINRLGRIVSKTAWMTVVLPLLAFLVFGWLFILANPDLVISFGKGLQQFFDVLNDWVRRFSPDLGEFGFWFAVLWVVLGLLRPQVDPSHFSESSADPIGVDDPNADAVDVDMYPALRNMLITVIMLFAAYLVFEFKTLWLCDFPRDFYYSGYAHDGAAWLTVALALATVILSLVFRGRMLRDARVRTLRQLAWLWSLENMILAIAVYNRLFIYVGFNGMSRMRIVGLYGMSAVVVGFALVLWKIAHNRDFLWLLRRHLWTLAIAIYLLALTPLDVIVVGYNVRRILAGDSAPSVQISVHPINAEGILLLQPLLVCDDPAVAEGVRALLAEHHAAAEATARRREALGWTSFQIADRVALATFRKNRNRWEQYSDPSIRRGVLKRFRDYAYQWY